MDGASMAKTVTLYDFLTPAEIERASALYDAAPPGTFARLCEQEIIKPCLARINTALGQENDARYLAYVVELALMYKRPPAPSVRR